ncbi:UNVERIFIED_CONTAM: division/cell wall cluster transcriptional repressor MraZ [Williamsia faeni]|jgi:MraZ protein
MASAMFFGTYTPKLDDKGRLTLPAKFRDALAGGVMITKGQDRSLAVHIRDDFLELAQRVLSSPKDDPAARAFRRQLSSGSDEQRPDGQGRITLSPDHRRYAGLAKECVVIGNISHLEIWDAQTWRDYQDEHEENFSSVGFDVLDTV